MAIQFESSIDVDGRGIIGSGNTIGTINASIIGANNNATTLSTVDTSTNTIIGDSNSGRYGNTVITDRTLRLGRADNTSQFSSNTTGTLNFNDSVQANQAFSNSGGIIGYFPPPTTSNNYYFFNAYSENVLDSVFQGGASPTASRMNFSTDPSLSCILQKFDANTTNSGAMYVNASNNSATASSRGIVTFDVRHQNQNADVPNGHSLFEVTAGYGQTKFLIKQVSGSTNVGIATTNPSEKLHVGGNMRLENQLYDSTNSQGANNDVLTKVSAGTEWKSISDLPIDGRYVAVAGDTMTGNLILDNGSTASPYVATQQASYPWGGSLTLGLRMRTDATAGILDFRRWTGSATTHGTALITQVNSDGGYGLDFRVDNKSTNTSATTSRMFLSTSGEVGIGTTSPSYKLDVSGDGAFGGTTISANTGLTVRARSGDIGDIRIRFDAAGTLQRSYISDYYTGEASNIGFERNNSTGTGIITFDTSNSGFSPSERMRIDANGNVGIGETNPDAKLTVFRTDSTYAVNLSNTESRAGLSVKSTSNFDSKLTISSGASSRQYIQAVNNAATTGRDIAINPYGGNVGIGTPSPTERLHIKSTASSSSSMLYLENAAWAVDMTTGIAFKNGANYLGPTAKIYTIMNGAGNQGGEIRFATLDYSATNPNPNTTLIDRMTIDDDGKVGIGTTGPSDKLEVAAANSQLRLRDTDDNNFAQFSYSSGKLVVRNNSTTTTVNQFTLDSIGRMGIGTTSPASKLEVAGDTSNALLTLKSLNGGANDAFMRFYDEGNGPAYSMGLDSSDEKFKIAYASDGDSLTSGTKLVMETSGNVAIGATTATEKLVVSGNAWITNNVYVGYGNTLKTCSYSPNYSLIVGENNTLGGVSNGIIGVSNTIECTAEPWESFGGNFIAGKNNTINNLYSHANAVFGQSNAVGDPTTPSNSVAGILVSGVGHSTFGDNSFAFGESCFTDINAKRSLTGGFDCNNFGYYGSVAIGAGATASTGNNQYAFGTGVTTPTSASAAYDSNQFVVGKFNVYSTGGRAHRFAVGNGFSDGIRVNAMNIDNFGRMGLGVTAPSYQLQLNSNSAAKPTSSSWTVVSDERVKTNIQDYTTGLTEILQINPKTFDYNGKAGFDTTTGNIGIIAQDVKDIMPETINTYEAKLNEDDAEETELFNFDSHPIQFALINAVKELNAKIEALEAKIQTLEGN
jgi:hypothetical protein